MKSGVEVNQGNPEGEDFAKFSSGVHSVDGRRAQAGLRERCREFREVG
jgi:hypothetical protein